MKGRYEYMADNNLIVFRACEGPPKDVATGFYVDVGDESKNRSPKIYFKAPLTLLEWNASVWKDGYTIIYVNGTNSVSCFVESGTKITLETPKKEGYTFAGWFTEASGGTSVGVGGASYTPTATTTLYAQWTANTYTVSYNGNGATSGSTTNSSHTYDVANNLTKNEYERSYTVTYNYNGNGTSNTTTTATATFNGWATSATGGKVYSDEQSVSNLTSKNNATVELYANWRSASINLPTAPTKDGYTFMGWSSGNSTYPAGTTVTIDADTNFTAMWKIDSSYITDTNLDTMVSTYGFDYLTDLVNAIPDDSDLCTAVSTHWVGKTFNAQFDYPDTDTAKDVIVKLFQFTTTSNNYKLNFLFDANLKKQMHSKTSVTSYADTDLYINFISKCKLTTAKGTGEITTPDLFERDSATAYYSHLKNIVSKVEGTQMWTKTPVGSGDSNYTHFYTFAYGNDAYDNKITSEYPIILQFTLEPTK